ncbi:MAG: FxLYD domain-containing protein [Synergistaceae bacterium]|jgi:hypothetical protein|nr:FxLYD domain-containing protein [Synergistaceae bacterium]
MKAAILGIFFGVGFFCGFLAGFGYSPARDENIAPLADRVAGVSAPASSADFGGAVFAEGGYGDDAAEPRDIGLILEDHWMDSDEGGLFIAGTVKNGGDHAYDAVRVAFDLCDKEGNPYTAVTDKNATAMAPGDTWSFTVYIPYSDMDKFSSYKFQSILAVTKQM